MMIMIFIGRSLPSRHSSKGFHASSHLSLIFHEEGHIIVPVYVRDAGTLSASMVCTAVRGGRLGAPPPYLQSDFHTES